jgi:hypothetical protein
MPVAGNKVFVYPNPSQEGFHIRIENPSGNRYSVELFNTNGNLVYRTDQTVEKGVRSEFYIDGTGIEKGIYFLKISSEAEQIIRRIVKL